MYGYPGVVPSRAGLLYAPLNLCSSLWPVRLAKLVSLRVTQRASKAGKDGTMMGSWLRKNKAERRAAVALLGCALLIVGACGNDDSGGSERGVGADCVRHEHCDEGQSCFVEFGGGYCTLEDCGSDSDCPTGSACVTYNGTNYCLLECEGASECNLNRAEFPATCVATLDFVEDAGGRSVCRPPN